MGAMETDNFEADVRRKFDPILLDKSFVYTNSKTDGYFDNCEIVYGSDRMFVSIARHRGSLGVYCGIRAKRDCFSWPLQHLAEFVFHNSGCGSTAKPDEFEYGECSFEIIELLLYNHFDRVVDYLNQYDIKRIQHDMELFSARITMRNIASLKKIIESQGNRR